MLIFIFIWLQISGNFGKDWNKFLKISGNFPREISELTTLYDVFQTMSQYYRCRRLQIKIFVGRTCMRTLWFLNVNRPVC